MNKTGDGTDLLAIRKVMQASTKYCVLQKKALCSGTAILLADVCNRIGIHAFVVLGEVSANGQTGSHAWVAVEIGNELYCVDQTSEIAMKKVSPLKTKQQFEEDGVYPYRYEFAKHFIWDDVE